MTLPKDVLLWCLNKALVDLKKPFNETGFLVGAIGEIGNIDRDLISKDYIHIILDDQFTVPFWGRKIIHHRNGAIYDGPQEDMATNMEMAFVYHQKELSTKQDKIEYLRRFVIEDEV